MNNAEEVSSKNIIVENVEVPQPMQASKYNLLNLYRPNNSKRNPIKSRKEIRRSSASRNLIFNTLGFKNPLQLHKATVLHNSTKGDIHYEPSHLIRKQATRSISPKAKHLGGRRLRKTKKVSKKH